MDKELLNFCLDTENPKTNYNLAKSYEHLGHLAPAHTYYFRAAERSKNDLFSYQSLIRASICCKKQNGRDSTEKILLENALVLCPNRPEAYYFLSLLYERQQDWQNCYIYSTLGLKEDVEDLIELDIPEYMGKYLLIFQKAVSSWWWGRGKESRDLFQVLVNEYWEDMDQIHKNVVESNITSLGSGPESQAFVPYTNENFSKLRYKFPGSEKIVKNYSQVYQDMFVLSMLNGKEGGTFLEIGGAHPFSGNNTALLEKNFGWTGISIEYDEKFISNYKLNRSTDILCMDALQIDYDSLLDKHFITNTIDYLQLDIEPAKNTYECLTKIPFDKYKFAVITYEHDYYVDVTRSYRQKSRDFLQDKGYVLVVSDVSPDGKSNFEDWWVHPDLVDPKILEIMKDTENKIKKIDDYFLIEA
jgi:tetratricopeptide (TPR) repeat protein